MPEIKPCPKDCKHDWEDFHKKLDIAIAHFIDEQDALPSKSTIMDLIEYSFIKSNFQKAGVYAPEQGNE